MKSLSIVKGQPNQARDKTMIKCTEIVKKFQSATAVNNVSLEIKQGEIFGLLGPNGAGKTTLIKMLSGQMQPTSGDIRIGKFDPTTQQKEVHKRIGIVFDHPNLYGEMSGEQNLLFAADLFGISNPHHLELLERFNLTKHAKKKVKNYSKGMKQRLLIARSLIHKPQILFLDEPTTGLDPHAAKILRSIILELAQDNLTVLLTTHYMQEADYLCDRVAFMHQGQIIALGPPQALKQAYNPSGHISVYHADGKTSKFNTHLDNNREQLATLVQDNNFVFIHSQEPTLEEVYLRLTSEEH